MIHSRSRLNCRGLKLKKCNGRALFLNICIKLQIFTVISCKFLSFISLLIFLPILYFYKCITFLISSMKKTVDTQRNWDPEWEIKLEKEPEFPKHTIKKIVSIADGYIKKGRKKTDSMKLIKLLNKADGFDGIEKFNLNLIQSLTGMNDSWTMMVVTFSTIAVACSNKTRECDDEFVLMVSNILPYVIYVDKIVGVNSKVDNIIDLVDAAMVVWFDIHFFRRWLKNINLPIIQTTEIKSLKEKLTTLRDSSTNYITTTGNTDKLRVTAAEWMNKSVEIVLHFLESDERGQDDDLFDKISEMVADILAACLVNLSKAINIKISDTPIEKREEVVKHAACIFGETQQVRQFAENRLSSISAAEDHKEYLEASWWKVVIEDTETGSHASHVSTYDLKIDVVDHIDDA